MNIEDLYSTGKVNRDTYDFWSLTKQEKETAWVQQTLSANAAQIQLIDGKYYAVSETSWGKVEKDEIPEHSNKYSYRYHYKKELPVFSFSMRIWNDDDPRYEGRKPKHIEKIGADDFQSAEKIIQDMVETWKGRGFMADYAYL